MRQRRHSLKQNHEKQTDGHAHEVPIVNGRPWTEPPTSVADLLDPRANGWTLVDGWDDRNKLFLLFIKNGTFHAELSSELLTHVNTLIRGHAPEDAAVRSLEHALLTAATMAHAMKEGKDCSSFNWDIMRRSIADNLTASLGISALEVLAADSLRRAELKKETAVALTERALSGIVRIKWLRPALRNRSSAPTELLAIEHARLLCEQLHRLPTKTEVRASLEAADFVYSSKSKGIKLKWISLFIRARLDTLPN